MLRNSFVAIVILAAVAAAGCGGDGTPASNNQADGGGNGNGGNLPPAGKFTLQLQTSGAGAVKGSGPDCRGNCGAAYDSGAVVHLQAVADPGNAFSGWAGACSGTSANCDLTMSKDQTAVAMFAALPPPPPSTFKLVVALDGQGRVTSAPGGIDCSGATCTADFNADTSVTLTAAPAANWKFAGWSGACSGTDGCVVKMSGDVQVGARFEAPPPPPATAHIILAVDGPGQVTGAGLNCGNGAATCDVTVPADRPVDLSASPNSQSRFMSWGGACSGSAPTCSITAKGEMRVTATFSYNLTTLVANDGTNIYTLAINSTDAFYVRNLQGEGFWVWAVSKNGGQPRKVASGMGLNLVADDGYVYWTDNTSIYSAPVGGGSASLLFSGASDIGRLVLDENGALYWTANVWTSRASVHRMQDRTDRVLVDNAQATPAVAVDDQFVYFGAYDTNRVGSVKRVAKTGGTVDTLTTCPSYCYFASMKADFENVYVRGNYGGEAWSMAKSRPALKLLSGPNGAATGYAINDIDANASVVYWNSVAYSANPTNGIFAARPDGSGWTAIDTGHDYNWYGPRVDDTAIYYWHAGALLKRLK